MHAPADSAAQPWGQRLSCSNLRLRDNNEVTQGRISWRHHYTNVRFYPNGTPLLEHGVYELQKVMYPLLRLPRGLHPSLI